ncbi:MAG: family 10 glycosylhydrolase [Firmicutes bacterium]|nr:family 10 glycosylhydrolase [Bacillota bacterium]
MLRRYPVLIAVVVAAGLAVGFFLGQRRPGAPATAATAVTGPGRAVRGLWVVRHELATPGSIDQVLATAQEVGATDLFVQVNGRGEAYYRSSLLPPASGIDPGFDPLDYVLRRAKSKGLRVHAWINAFTAASLSSTPEHPDHVLNRHPDWVTVDRDGRTLWEYSLEEAMANVPARMLDPGLPGVQAFVFEAVMEVVERYPVDGIHLDYARYPSRRFGYHPESVARFQAVYGFDPGRLEQDAAAFVAQNGWDAFDQRMTQWDRWRREQVTGLMQQIRQGLKERRPGMLLSAAVHADIDDAVNNRLQDWPFWVRSGLLDFVVPMAYHRRPEPVAEQVAAAVSASEGRTPVYAGLAAHLLTGDPAQLAIQAETAYAAGARGIVVFSHEVLAASPELRSALTKTVETAGGPAAGFRPGADR